MPASSFSSVLLPAPLRPMIPSRSPSPTVRLMCFQGLDLEGGLLRAAEQPVEQIFLEADAAESPHLKPQSDVVELNQAHGRQR